MFTDCPKDRHYVLEHHLIYMIIIIYHVTWYLGLTRGCLISFCEIIEQAYYVRVFIGGTTPKQAN